MERLYARARVAVLAAAIVPAAVAIAQPELPNENHYKLYNAYPNPTYQAAVVLRDQFGLHAPAGPFTLERFANPTEKTRQGGTRFPNVFESGDAFPIVDPVIHQVWWRIGSLPEPRRDILVTDQFGSSRWSLGNAVYLVNPALKNVPPPAEPPAWNHYLCYEASVTPDINEFVYLTDQFGMERPFLVKGKWFCTPVEKQIDGRIYPIVDAAAHLACYSIEGQLVGPGAIFAIDQFGSWDLTISAIGDCLCAPALKELPVRAEQSTWGRIKALYR